jgi:hypothetical protein
MKKSVVHVLFATSALPRRDHHEREGQVCRQPDVDASSIKVETLNGTVLLSGFEARRSTSGTHLNAARGRPSTTG